MPQRITFMHEMQDTLDNLSHYERQAQNHRLRQIELRDIANSISRGVFPNTIRPNNFWGNTYTLIGGRIYTTRNPAEIEILFPIEIRSRISGYDSFELGVLNNHATSDPLSGRFNNLCHAWQVDTARMHWSYIQYSCIGCGLRHEIRGDEVR